MPLYLSNRPIQKDGGQARDGPSSVHMTRNQRPPGPSAPRGDTPRGDTGTSTAVQYEQSSSMAVYEYSTRTVLFYKIWKSRNVLNTSTYIRVLVRVTPSSQQVRVRVGPCRTVQYRTRSTVLMKYRTVLMWRYSTVQYSYSYEYLAGRPSSTVRVLVPVAKFVCIS